MSWVLWDIITPLLLSFALGLTLGWLLWRWRRKQISVGVTDVVVEGDESGSASVEGSVVESSAEKMESINAVLIAERDEAVERASAAENSLSEAQVEMLKLKTELPDPDTVVAESGVSEEEIDNSEKFQNLVALLAKEQEQRAEIDLELTEANERYEFLEREHAKVKDAVAEVDETKLATLQEDLDLSQKVIEEKDQQYLDSVLEMEKLIEQRDERIAALETTITDAANIASEGDTAEVQPSDQESSNKDDQSDAEDSNIDKSNTDNSVVDQANEKQAGEADASSVDVKLADDAETTVFAEDDAGEAQAQDEDPKKDPADTDRDAGQQAPGHSPASVVSSNSARRPGGQSEAKISQATAAEIAVALTEEFDIDADKAPKPVLASVQATSNDDNGRAPNDTMASVNVQGFAANEDSARGEQSDDTTADRAVTEAVQEQTVDSDDNEVVESVAEDSELDSGNSAVVTPQMSIEEDTPDDGEKGASNAVSDEQGAAEDDSDPDAASALETEADLPANDNEPTVQPDASQDSVSGSDDDNGEVPVDESADQTKTDDVEDANDESHSALSEPQGEAESGTGTTPDDSAIEEATDASVDRAEDKNQLSTQDGSQTTAAAAIEETRKISVGDDEAISADAAPKKSVKAKKNTGRSSVSTEKTSKKATAKKKASKKKKAKNSNANGYSPTAWEVPARVPAENDRDQLKDIKGVGPVLEGLLNDSGIYYFKQVALLDKDGINELQDQIPQFPGRIKRDKWVSQAKSLHRKKYGVAAKNS